MFFLFIIYPSVYIPGVVFDGMIIPPVSSVLAMVSLAMDVSIPSVLSREQ